MYAYGYIILLPSVYGKNYIITGPYLSTTPPHHPNPNPSPIHKSPGKFLDRKEMYRQGRIPFTVNACYRLKVITQNRFFPSPGERKRADIS